MTLDEFQEAWRTLRVVDNTWRGTLVRGVMVFRDFLGWLLIMLTLFLAFVIVATVLAKWWWAVIPLAVSAIVVTLCSIVHTQVLTNRRNYP